MIIRKKRTNSRLNMRHKSGIFHQNLHHHILIICLMLLIFISSTSDHFASGAANCQFPLHWAGTWFQKGLHDPLVIVSSNISVRGTCVQNDGEKFLMHDRGRGCYRCMVINEKHVNVLQYKETYCMKPQGRLSLNKICREINGDAPLYSLFKLNIPPVDCPFQGPFTFSYSRGFGECKKPVSTIQPCTDHSQLLLKFQACADIHGSESILERLECYGMWREGSVRYFVGKLYKRGAKTDEDQFRCFVFDKKNSTNYWVAQSGDATCDGLLSPTEGSRTMKLVQSEEIRGRCDFPNWLASSRHWKTIDGSRVYDFSQNATYKVYNTTTGRIFKYGYCMDARSSSKSVAESVVFYKANCESGYFCMRIHRRNSDVVEIEIGETESSPSDACNNFRRVKLLTLRQAINRNSIECPVSGKYSLAMSQRNWDGRIDVLRHQLSACPKAILESRCDSSSTLQIKCTHSNTFWNFECQSKWENGGAKYLIMRSKDEKKEYCLSYTTNGTGIQAGSLNEENCNSMLDNTMGFDFKLIYDGICDMSGTKGSSSKPHIIDSNSFMLNCFIIAALIARYLFDINVDRI